MVIARECAASRALLRATFLLLCYPPFSFLFSPSYSLSSPSLTSTVSRRMLQIHSTDCAFSLFLLFYFFSSLRSVSSFALDRREHAPVFFSIHSPVFKYCIGLKFPPIVTNTLFRLPFCFFCFVACFLFKFTRCDLTKNNRRSSGSGNPPNVYYRWDECFLLSIGRNTFHFSSHFLTSV